jgi:hypothetical protein
MTLDEYQIYQLFDNPEPKKFIGSGEDVVLDENHNVVLDEYYQVKVVEEEQV